MARDIPEKKSACPADYSFTRRSLIFAAMIKSLRVSPAGRVRIIAYFNVPALHGRIGDMPLFRGHSQHIVEECNGLIAFFEGKRSGSDGRFEPD